MYYIKNITFKISLIASVVFLLATCVFLQANAEIPKVQADLAPRIFITETKITKTLGNEVQGEFTVLNNETYYLSDLSYEIKLLQGSTYEDFKLIDVVVDRAIFAVPPGEKVVKTFKYSYPKNIGSDNYTLRTQIITSRGTELGWNDLLMPLTGENKFLDIQRRFSKILVDLSVALPSSGESGAKLEPVNNPTAGKEVNKKSDQTEATSVGSATVLSLKQVPAGTVPVESKLIATPSEGILVNSKSDVIVIMRVQNSGQTITVIPKIKIFQRQFNMPLVKEYNDAPIVFAKGEVRDVQLKMPNLDIPESYLAEVKFYQNNLQVSGIEYFRWVVEGDSGKIMYIKADKDFYKAGENINLIVQTSGPADASNGGIGQLQVVVFDKNGNVISKKLSDVSLEGLVTVNISIPVAKDLVSPIINVKLTKADKNLDEQKINLPVFSPEAKILEKNRNQQLLIFYLQIILAVIVILIIGIIFYKLKIKQGKK